MQNMLVMRFANRFLGPMWNAVHISNTQVSLKLTPTHACLHFTMTSPGTTLPREHPSVFDGFMNYEVSGSVYRNHHSILVLIHLHLDATLLQMSKFWCLQPCA